MALGMVSVYGSVLKITPLGSHDGEFCARDRALILEDPNGTRFLYDAGRTVAGASDPRLGKIDAVLVSHMHGDHVGNVHIEKPNAGSCAKPLTLINALPDTSSVRIAMAKGAQIITGSEMPKFFASKLKALGGNPKDARLVRFGASLNFKGVTITTVPAVHSNGIAPGMIGGELAKLLMSTGLTAYAGPPTGYILRFTNGLVVYLSGDTGITAEQESVVRKFYNAKLAVMNIGNTYTTGPKEAAFVVNKLIKPESVIASHANEAATKNGKLLGDSRTATFIKASRIPVYLPLSGRTMWFDSKGRCKKGCQ
ncbi:MAG: MBL fold metallo-hydrolase [Gammaproteobacteria bacterium]|nr:MBL fold metallo-hydrolase [Gammaproteobacteria bacterium]